MSYRKVAQIGVTINISCVFLYADTFDSRPLVTLELLSTKPWLIQANLTSPLSFAIPPHSHLRALLVSSITYKGKYKEDSINSPVKVVKVDLDNHQELVNALKGNEAVILSGKGEPERVIDAAIEAGVKRIIPSEFGGCVELFLPIAYAHLTLLFSGIRIALLDIVSSCLQRTRRLMITSKRKAKILESSLLRFTAASSSTGVHRWSKWYAYNPN